jgi:hypothetical protein
MKKCDILKIGTTRLLPPYLATSFMAGAGAAASSSTTSRFSTKSSQPLPPPPQILSFNPSLLAVTSVSNTVVGLLQPLIVSPSIAAAEFDRLNVVLLLVMMAAGLLCCSALMISYKRVSALAQQQQQQQQRDAV